MGRQRVFFWRSRRRIRQHRGCTLVLGLLGFRALRFWRGFRVQGFRISDLGDRIRHFAFSGVPLFASLLQDAQKQIVTVFGAGVPDVNHLINPGDVRPVGTFVPGRAIAAFCIFLHVKGIHQLPCCARPASCTRWLGSRHWDRGS